MLIRGRKISYETPRPGIRSRVGDPILPKVLKSIEFYKSRFVFAIYKDIYTSIVQQEASGRSVTEYMMDGVSAKSELQADEFMSLFCRIIDWETFPDFIHL